ncbi:MFS transporter [Streptomyces sp. NBC_01476]|uniref:MFS transporter n=1 Tax=Streptomyces sp. NBC_01476 TaxID=2903881 RepID=UPI002E2F2663|nr:MFS transporter [Streptomyces sp. NBC_01476]
MNRSEHGADAVDPHYERRWLILLVVLISQVMILIDATVINVALPSAQKSLHFSDAARQWVVTAYVLAFGSLLPLGGRLADLVGRKLMFVVGLVGFGVFSALAGAAPDTAVLLIARTLQGVFAAALAPTAVSMITVTFTDPTERNKAFAVFGAVGGSAGALGLLLGGVLTSSLDWRWTMFVNIAFAAVALVGALALMTNSADPHRPRLDLPGALLASGGLFLLVFGSAKAETDGWSAPLTVASLAGGILLLLGFVGVERRAPHPLIPLRVVLDRNRGAAYLSLLLGSASLFALFLFLTYYFQGILGYSPIRTGLAFLPLPVGIAVGATVAQSVLLPRLTARSIIGGGLSLSAAGAALLAQVGLHAEYASRVLPGLVLVGAGVGAYFVIATTIGSVPDDPEDAGTAGSMNNVSQQIGTALGVALISTFVASATSGYLHSHGPAGPLVLARASVHGYAVGFWWGAAVFAITAVVCTAMIRPRTTLAATASPPVPEPVSQTL